MFLCFPALGLTKDFEKDTVKFSEPASDSGLEYYLSFEPDSPPSTFVVDCVCEELSVSNRLTWTEFHSINLLAKNSEPSGLLLELSVDCAHRESSSNQTTNTPDNSEPSVNFERLKHKNLFRDRLLKLSLSLKKLSAIVKSSLFRRKRVFNSFDTICCLER